MSSWSGDCRSLKDTVRDLLDLVSAVNQRYHHEQGRGDNDCVRVLGNLKVLLLVTAHTISPEAFDVRRPNDFTCDSFWAVVFREDKRAPHVPKPKWTEAKSNPLVKNWFTL